MPRKPYASGGRSSGGRSGGQQNRGGRPQTGNRRFQRQQPKGVIYKASANAKVVTTPESGIDLGHYLADNLPGKWSVRAVRRLLGQGAVTVNGQLETFGSRRLKKGEIVDFSLPSTDDQQIDRFEPKRLLFDDLGVVAYDKPAGLAVTPTDAGKMWHLQKLLGDAIGNVHPVHRIDADTSGIVLFARSKLLAEEMTAWFRDHKVKKTYQAIVRGYPKESGERRTYLVVKDAQPGFEKWGTGRGQDAREALTKWAMMERLGAYGTLVEVEPATGRHHQIRIHFSEMGHALYGDRVYGDRRDPVLCKRHMLHASKVRIPRPSGGKPIAIRSKLPRDMEELAEELKKLRE